MTKTCRRCHRDLSARDFGRDKTSADGLWCVCHECFRANVVALKGTNTKNCPVCHTVKRFAEFSLCRVSPDGMHQMCRVCSARESSKYYHRYATERREAASHE